MPEYFCECCNYTTTRKSNIDKHNSTKNHLEKLNADTNKSSNNVILNPVVLDAESSFKIKILQLESIVKQKEEEIQALKNIIENLTNQNQEKQNEEPKLFSQKVFLKPKLIKNQNENVLMKFEEADNNEKLNIELNLNIETFFETYIKNSQETKYTYKYDNNGFKITALKKIYYQKGNMFNITKAVIEVILDAISALPVNTRFFICKDINRRRFEILSQGKIISSKENEEEVDKLIQWLFKSTYYFLYNAFGAFNAIFTKNWNLFSSDEEEILKVISEKKFCGEALTEQEDRLYKKKCHNSRIIREFKNAVGIDYELFKSSKGWYDDMSGTFASFESYDIGKKHLKVALATNKLNIKEILKESPKPCIVEEDEESEEEEN
jgi:hypothetical protein